MKKVGVGKEGIGAPPTREAGTISAATTTQLGHTHGYVLTDVHVIAYT